MAAPLLGSTVAPLTSTGDREKYALVKSSAASTNFPAGASLPALTSA